MPETYKKLFPGNFIAHLNAHALPNASFKTAGRASGAPEDRHNQAVLFMPGWMAVRKTGYAKIGAAASVFPIILPSPDLRPDDKPRVDINGLWIPQNAFVVRAGFRVQSRSFQPGAEAGATNDLSANSGITGTATGKLVLSSVTPTSTLAAGSTSGTKITTGTDSTATIIGTDGLVPIGSNLVSSAFGTPQQITQAGGLTLSLYSMNSACTAGSNISSTVLGGAYIACEMVYMVPEGIAEIDDIHLPGSLYSGQTP
jgi:hypothetical protein